MSPDIRTTPAPWAQEWATADLIMVRGPIQPDGTRETVAAVDGPNAEPNAALIAAAPIMANAIRASDWPTATAIVARLDGAA